MARLHGERGRLAEMQLGGREVAMSTGPGSSLGADDALSFEVPDHAWREAHRLSGRPDAGRVLGSFVHDAEYDTIVSDYEESGSA